MSVPFVCSLLFMLWYQANMVEGQYNGVAEELPLLFRGISCVGSSTPWQCGRETLVKSLDYWEAVTHLEKEKLIDEISSEITHAKESTSQSRKLGDVDVSNIISSTLTDVDIITDTISYGLNGVPSSNESASVEEARGKGNKKGSYGSYEHDDYGYGYYRGKGKGGKGKKKKGYMKLFMVGAALKAKLEMLLKLLSFHLQLKFFAIAAIGLIVNIARFWLDIKKGQAPQKVIYYEHAQHQHHYDEQHGDDWNGGYWKRSNDPYINSYSDMKI